MLHSSATPSDKRRRLRAALGEPGALQFPGAFNALSARLIEQSEFPGVYVSGAVVSAELGLPDIGLTTLTEVSEHAQQISRMTNVPTIVDADTGFGEPMNVARAVQVMEDAGVSAIHIEDQVNPKRCGHLDGKTVVDDHTAIRRIRAAVDARRDSDFMIIARTDIRAVEGFSAALERAQALADAGADLIFPEALTSLEEFEQIARSLSVPILANMTEFGKSELFSHQQLAEVGVKIVIYPVSLLRLAMGAAERGLKALKEHGSLQSSVPDMQTRAELYELLDYPAYVDFDTHIYSSPDFPTRNHDRTQK